MPSLYQVNASLTAVSISKLQAFQTYGKHCAPFSMASLARRAFNAHFLEKIFAHLASGQTLKKKPQSMKLFVIMASFSLYRPKNLSAVLSKRNLSLFFNKIKLL